MANRTLIITICSLLLVSCPNPEKRRLNGELERLEQRYSLLSQSLLERKASIGSSGRRINDLQADLARYNGEVEAFLLDHKLAAICIGAAAISLGDDNEYADDVKELAGWGTFGCALALLDQEFMSEVASVADRLVQADQRAKNINAQIATIQATIETEQRASESDQAEVDDVSLRISAVREKLKS